MSVDRFLAQVVSIDLEINESGKLYAIGAQFAGREFLRQGRFNKVKALRELDRFTAPAGYLLGHNILHHDLPLLRALVPDLKLFNKPVIDTLYFSPLAFPENPYHRLVKDYKLVRDTLNDPVADARLALSVFRDQWARFSELNESEPDILAFYRYCLDTETLGRGFCAALDAMGVEQVGASRALEIIKQQLVGQVCSTNFLKVIFQTLPDPEKKIAIAYAIAWLRVAGGNSVLPPWVRRKFADVAPIIRQLRDVPCDQPECSYCRESHDPITQLKRYFGFSSFRNEPTSSDGESLQQSIVLSAMGDQPLFAILPTGGGKSLCYQLPALVRYQRRGVLTIIISPLQALMKDQVDNLRNKTGSPNAAALYGLLTAPERGEVLDGIRLGDVALLYVSPEQLRNRSFTAAISHREIGCWVFDEAHCLSKWGHDFRPDYLYAARFIKEFTQQQQALLPPVQCFTATAKEDVKSEIIGYFQRELGQELALFEGGVERHNLQFEVQMVNRAEKEARVHHLLMEHLNPEGEGCALVYCATRKRTEELAEYLLHQGWDAAAFHAGLEAPVKRHIQENFSAGVTRVICATNAFGMGIDKNDVRLVIHAEIPGSLENYLQEAGRAGRDREVADCVLLYDESDIETQFKMGSFSELSLKDIAQILRGLRSAGRNRKGEVVLTSGELLRSERVDASFDMDDRNANTKVVTAVAWLERAGFIERNQNRTQVFQGRPQVKGLEEAKERMAKLNLSARQEQRWLAILDALINAQSDEGFSADELAQHAAFSRDESERASDGKDETESQRVLRTLYDMADVGLIEKSLQLTAYIRHGVKQASNILLEQVCALEREMLGLLPEEAPDADQGEWQSLSLRRLNQRLCDLGHESNPEILRSLLQGLSHDGQGLAGSRGSIDLRYSGQDHYRVKLQRSWQALEETAERRRAVAQLVLVTIIGKIPAVTGVSADLLVEFSAEEILDAIRGDIILSSQLKDPLAAIDRALMFLHEMRVITLQKGLAVFRQAMTIRILPERKGVKYTKGDYEPLSHHYAERIFQVHVINEYARKGLEKIGQALNLVAAYFAMDKSEFVERYFPGQGALIGRATSQKSYQRIVDDLENPVQQSIVAAKMDDNMLVLAGPGSGKTRAVVHRCAYLLRVERQQPDTILVLCFNRNAANSLRRHLHKLVATDLYGVTIQTYHGLALRLTGHSLSERRNQQEGEMLDFDAVLKEAVALLKGEKALLGLEPDQVREQLLAGYRHILVDEYQDIDADQYELVSAIAGRTLEDEDQKTSIMAVGDDDQNIYQFRGANIEFIHRFREEYQAQVHYLVDNYRSSHHIITATNQLIAHNHDRMKGDHACHINPQRTDLDPGGRWGSLDPLGRGRVQLLTVNGLPQQALALITELKRLKQLHAGMRWSDCAVFSRRWSVLEPVRALCEQEGIPVAMMTDTEKLPSPFKVREIRRYLDLLASTGEVILNGDQLLEQLDSLPGLSSESPWWKLLHTIVEAWKEETVNSVLPVKQAVEYVCEALMERQRGAPPIEGLFLSTVHSAKGMEFAHVFVPAGGWDGSQQRQEEERRLYYVAMTRARETLCLFQLPGDLSGFASELEGDFLLKREAVIDEDISTTALGRRYTLLSLADVDLGFAGRRGSGDPIHRHLAQLQVGDALQAVKEGDEIHLHHNKVTVARLSKSACQQWCHRLQSIEAIRITAMVQYSTQTSDEKYHSGCRVDEWEVPLVEIVYKES
ncbi:MAG: RecQ family ATP-dependent DNA helicase [Sedimenticola sp.]